MKADKPTSSDPSAMELGTLDGSPLNKDVDAAIAQNPDKFPKAVWFILPNEFGERFTYYAVSAFINRYLQFIGASAESAKLSTHSWKMITYFCPLFGAALSDSYFGKYKTIVGLSFIYLLGNIVLVVTSIPSFRTLGSVSAGLYLIAVGTGGIKPCVGPHGGDQFLPTQGDLLRRFFALFYIAINLGSLLTGFVTPALKDATSCWGDAIKSKEPGVPDTTFCYTAGFALPTAVFLVSFAVFVYGDRYYRVAPPQGEFVPYKMLLVTWDAVRAYIGGERTMTSGPDAAGFFSLGAGRFGLQFAQDTGEFLSVLAVIFPIAFVWMVYDQQSTEWQQQYDRMNQVFFGANISPETWIAVVNPVLVVSLLYVLATIVYPFLETRIGVRVTPLRRMVLGSALVMAGFLVSGWLQGSVMADFDGETDAKGFQVPHSCKNCVHGAWQMPQWILLSLGEAMFSPTGNEFAYTQVSESMKAISSSFWLLLVAIGNLSVVLVEDAVSSSSWATFPSGDSRPAKFYLYTGIGAVAVLWLAVGASRFKYKPGTESA
ncbi:POT family-domain-containing protein [Blastocladiella britannica]|nr:POT family-domain-containing protein [Blastocladiella britannica]